MDIIETKAHAGPDGVLRIEASVGRAGADCTVIIYVHADTAAAADDPWQALRERVAAGGRQRTVRLPPPRRRAYRPFTANEMPGPSASSILLLDRR